MTGHLASDARAALHEEVRRRAAAGESAKTIAEAVGVCTRNVNKIRKAAGLSAVRLIAKRPEPKPARLPTVAIVSAYRFPVLDRALRLEPWQPAPMDRTWPMADLDATGWERKRDVRCRKYDACLDLALLGHWTAWTCALCTHQGEDRLTDAELEAETGPIGAGPTTWEGM